MSAAAIAQSAALGIPEDQPLPPEDRVPSLGAPSRSLDDLYRTQAPLLLRYFQRRTGNSHAAPDLVQDTFARFADSGRLPELRNPAAYLQRIARNLLTDRARRPVNRETFLPLEEWDAKTLPAQEDTILAQDLLRCYENAIAALPERTRMVFLLQRADGLTYRQIARRLAVPQRTVKYHMTRALQHFYQALDAQ